MPKAKRSGSVAKLSLPTLTDSFGRMHKSLRISVTDRCNLRCTYCMPEDATFLDSSALLSFDEIVRFTKVAVAWASTTSVSPAASHYYGPTYRNWFDNW